MGTDRSKWLQYSDNNLINGKMDFNCSSISDVRPCTNNAPLAKFAFQQGKAHRIRLINAGAAGQQVFSIDEHQMTVIANDYVPIKPYKTKTVFLGVSTLLWLTRTRQAEEVQVGQRTDVVVKADGVATGSYWMRSNISTICNLPLQPQALAEIYYEKADTANKPTTNRWPYTDNGKCNNDDLSLTTPYYAINPDPSPDKTYEFLVDQKVNATGHLEWRLNQQAFRGNYNKPLLLLTQQEKNQSYAPEWNVVQPGNSKSVRLIINNNSTISHVSNYRKKYVFTRKPLLTISGKANAPSRPQHVHLTRG